jgi:hypothetical protein
MDRYKLKAIFLLLYKKVNKVQKIIHKLFVDLL